MDLPKKSILESEPLANPLKTK